MNLTVRAALVLAAPAILVVLLLLVWPVLALIAESFGDEGDVFANYRRIVEVPTYLSVIVRTMAMSLVTALICLLLGYPLAYHLVHAGAVVRGLILVSILIPFWTNLLVRSYGWIVMLNPRGVINRTLIDLGLIDEPLKLIYNATGVLIGMTQIMLPFMIIPIAAVMSRQDPRVMQAARSLGAGPAQAFLRVYFPLTLVGVIAGAILVFTISIGFFVIPAILGGSREIFLAQLIEFNVNSTVDWGFAAALATVLLVATLALIWVGDRWFDLGRLWGAK